MLETLRIQNFALIERIELDFGPGFNVLTGETGAGKSILIGALQLVLGARASSDVVRQGEQRAIIEMTVKLDELSPALTDLLAEQELEPEDGRLLLARHVGADGRSKAFAGGRLVPLSILAAIGDELVDLHGQHEHQSLLKSDRQLLLLDAYAGSGALAADVREAVAALRVSEAELEALQQEDRERERRIDFLRHELAEIQKAAFKPGEDEELKARLKRIQNAEQIHTLASDAYGMLYGNDEGAALDAIDRALNEVQELAQLDETLAPTLRELTEARELVNGVAETLRGYTEESDFDAGELEELNQRNALLGQLKRKYGGTVEEILAYGARAAEELDRFDTRDARVAELTKQCAAQRDSAGKAAAALGKQRRSAAKKLDQAITANLQELGMKGAVFQTSIEHAPLTSTGTDDVKFLLAANPGEPAKPLRQVASGGEVSRIMLALKAVFAEADAIPTLIFDEIDTGVGGEVARAVAGKIAGLAATHQVLCVSHLAQIGAVATTHFRVAKASDSGHTVTAVTEVTGKERIEEIARLLDGSVSAESVRHAKALMKELGGKG
ncbi:MAG: DNA repair protein RecN [Candidatus Hydrogenedens sp.]|nr:DNA repair protein RecN [Candidatus Hydrogenedens sp.]